MFTYSQRTGMFTHNGVLLGTGYSGLGLCKNNPDMQNVVGQGPIPQGFYTIEPAVEGTMHGPLALPLTPEAGNHMFGREGFMIHGDSTEHPGQASHGCIILPREVREAILTSGDDLLEVAA